MNQSQSTSRLISVIVPIYNVNPYLHEAVESIITQSYPNLEIILIDDGSTDGSGEICDIYRNTDSRVKVIHQDNQGLSAARNAGLDICQGQMIAFLDGDDAFCQDALSIMAEAMRKSGADIVECNGSLYVTSGKMDPDTILQNKRLIKTRGQSSGLFTGREALHMKLEGRIADTIPNKLYRREMWDNFRFPVGKNFEDTIVILPLLARAETVFTLSDTLLMYRQRSDSITKTCRIRSLKNRAYAFDQYLNYIESHIPEYFSAGDLTDTKARVFAVLLKSYFEISAQSIRNKEKYMAYYRKILHNYRIDVDIKKYAPKIYIAALVCFYFPVCIIGLIYKAYCKWHQFFSPKANK